MNILEQLDNRSKLAFIEVMPSVMRFMSALEKCEEFIVSAQDMDNISIIIDCLGKQYNTNTAALIQQLSGQLPSIPQPASE